MSIDVLVVEVEMPSELDLRYPAVTSHGECYLIQGTKIIGRVRMVSGYGMMNGMYSDITIQPDDDATKEFFKDDYTVVAGLGGVYGLRYDGITGKPMPGLDDEPEDRHKGTEIVDTVDFDFGIAHPRFKVVEGWANVINRPKPRVHTKHQSRRPRSSNKIKKVA